MRLAIKAVHGHHLTSWLNTDPGDQRGAIVYGIWMCWLSSITFFNVFGPRTIPEAGSIKRKINKILDELLD